MEEDDPKLYFKERSRSIHSTVSAVGGGNSRVECEILLRYR